MIINKIKRSALCLSLLAAVSCTDNFEEINTNPESASNEQLAQDFNNIKSLIKPAFNRLFISDVTWEYQIQQSLQADAWSGYMITPAEFGGINNHSYVLNKSWNSKAWDDAYVSIIAYLYKVEQRAKGSADNYYSWSLILKAATMQRITDMYGPAVYSQYGKDSATYDSQQEIYTNIFADLDFAVNDLTARIAAGESVPGNPTAFTGTDLSVYNGDYTQWVKFANSLRLRMAMRISKVDPALAKVQAEKAVSHSVGVFTTDKDNMLIQSPQNLNVIDVMSHIWGGLNMGADMESILGGYDDPRIAKYWNVSTIVPGKFKGVRTGITYPDGAYAKFSRTGSRTKTGQVTWMSTAEAYFLRAEGALRGWNMGGTAKDLYESGVKASFNQNGVAGADAYLADNTKMAMDYVDPANAANSVAAVSKITVAWGADKEKNLEKIITQKWIATYPDGQEAWSEYRRTGYPKLFRISNNNSGGEISTALGVRRLGFSEGEFTNNKAGYDSGVSKLGGPDNGGTRLWWDVDKANF